MFLPLTSPGGAKMASEKINKRNLFNEQVSIEVGTLILKDCLVASKNNEAKAMSCYNGAKNRVYYNKVKKQEHILTAYVKSQTVSTLAQSD